MYQEFYELATAPFTLNVDRKCFYFGSRQREALAQIFYALREGKGLMVVEGAPGTGKTTLLDMALGLLPESLGMLVCRVINPLVLEQSDLLEEVLRGFGRKPARGARVNQLSRRLLAFLEGCQESRLRPLLVVDEAQALTEIAMEQLRVLTNWERDGKKLVQIVLAGQPELSRRYLDDPAHEALRQRISVHCHLSALEFAELTDYVRLRLRRAGLRAGGDFPEMAVFTNGGLRELYRFSGGVPRLINILADHSLVAGFAAGEKPVRDTVVAGVAKSLGWRPVFESLPLLPPRAAAGSEPNAEDMFRAFLSGAVNPDAVSALAAEVES